MKKYNTQLSSILEKTKNVNYINKHVLFQKNLSMLDKLATVVGQNRQHVFVNDILHPIPSYLNGSEERPSILSHYDHPESPFSIIKTKILSAWETNPSIFPKLSIPISLLKWALNIYDLLIPPSPPFFSENELEQNPRPPESEYDTLSKIDLKWKCPSMFLLDMRAVWLELRLHILLYVVELIQNNIKNHLYPIKVDYKTKNISQDCNRVFFVYENIVCKHFQQSIDVVNSLYAIIDSHMPLIAAINYISDNYASQLDMSFHDPFVFAAPKIENAIQCHMLPHIYSFMDLTLDYSCDSAQNSRLLKKRYADILPKDLSLLDYIIQFMHVLVPNRTNVRCPEKPLRLHCTKDIRFATVILKLVAATRLGVYPTSATKALFSDRLAIYSQFYTPYSANDISALITSEFSSIIITAGKEFYFYSLSQTSAYKQVLAKTCNIPAYELAAFMSSEYLRTNGIVSDELRAYFAKMIHKTSINYNLDVIIRKCKNINYSRYTIPTSFDIVSGNYQTLPHPTPKIPSEEFIGMKQIISSFSIEKNVPMSWLLYFGLSFESLLKIKTAVYSKKPHFGRIMTSLPLSDYAIIYNFFELCKARTKKYEIDTHVTIYAAQLESLLKINNIPFSQELPPVLGSVVVCENCDNFKTTSSFTKAGFSKISGTKSHTMIDVANVTVCACKPRDSTWKEKYLVEHGKNPPANNPDKYKKSDRIDIRRKKIARSITTKILHKECQKTPVTQINIVGKILVYGGQAQMACMDDFTICPVDCMYRYSDRIVCRLCYIKRMVEVGNTKGKFIPRRTLPNVPNLLNSNSNSNFNSNITSASSSNFNDISSIYCTPVSTVRENTKGNIIEPCSKCNKTTSQKPRVSCYVADSESNTFKTIYFCKFAHGNLSWIEDGDYVQKQNILNDLISEKYGPNTSFGMWSKSRKIENI
jgi:hypothetical protein